MTHANWLVVKKNGVWAVDTAKKASRVKEGDRIVFYVNESITFREYSRWQAAGTSP